MAVYVVNDDGHDFSSAKQFGELTYITTGKVNIFATDRLQRDISQSLQNFAVDDYLLFSGPIILNILVILEVAKRIKLIRVLIFNFITKQYSVRDIKGGA